MGEAGVAPYMGAWIEISPQCNGLIRTVVAPYMGAWIEIMRLMPRPCQFPVAPYMGAWIEMLSESDANDLYKSLPTWERGLKCLS